MIQNNRYYWANLKTRNVTVSVSPKKRKEGVVFRVGNMIDLGGGRQTVMLENVDYPQSYYRPKNKDGVLAVPFRMGTLDFVYTSPKQPAVRDVHSLLSVLYKDENLEKIVPDVLTPGDLLVFKHNRDTQEIQMVEALRVVKENSYQKSQAEYAL